MRLKQIIIGTLIIFTASCKVGKDYKRPETGLPEQYRDTPLGSVENTDSLPGIQTFFKDRELLKLIDTAVKQNNELKIAVRNITAAEAMLKQVRLNYLPELSARVNANHTYSSKNSLAGVGNQQFIGSQNVDDFTAAIGLSWELDIWGKVKREKEEALSNLLQNVEVKRAVQTRLVANLANGYYNLLMLDNQLLTAKKSLGLNDSTLTLLKVQYRVGETNTLGIQQAKAELEVTRQLIPQIEQSIAIQENAISLLSGNYAKSVSRKTSPDTTLNAQSKTAYPVSLLAARPDIRAAEFALRAANARTGITQAAMYPALTITANGGLNSFKSSSWFTIPGSLFGDVAGGLVQPLFQRGRLKTQYKLALIEREKQVINFRQAVLEGYAQVSDALVSQEKLAQQYQAALNREHELEKGIAAAAILFRTGMANYLEIITANQNYLQARLQTAQLYRDNEVAKIELYRALGGGWR